MPQNRNAGSYPPKDLEFPRRPRGYHVVTPGQHQRKAKNTQCIAYYIHAPSSCARLVSSPTEGLEEGAHLEDGWREMHLGGYFKILFAVQTWTKARGQPQGDEASIVDYRAGSPFACFAGTVYVHDFTCYALRQQQFFSTRRARALGVRGRNIRGRISLR